MHAAVFPSRCIETYGLVLDEAFELGVPVVVPAIGALDERAGDAGQRFELNDPGSLACALGALVEDPALYQRLLEAVPRSLPSFDGHVESVLALYAEPMNPPLAAHQPISVEERLRHQLQRAQPLFQKLLEKGEGEPYGPR